MSRIGFVGVSALSFGLVASCGSDGARESGSNSGSASADDGIASITATGEGTGQSDDADAGDDDLKLDAASQTDLGVEGCAGDSMSGGNMGDTEGEVDFSYIWIANSGEGTMSKIDTVSMMELGRYIVRPDSLGNPSRTSVNLSGDVAIANRAGGVTKVYALEERCVDANGNGTIETSHGSAFLPWGQDECVAWHTPFQVESQRPVAWAPGTWNQSTCGYDNEDLWTATGTNAGGIDVHLMDGDSGAVLNSVHIPEMTFDGYGIYGGAVDGEGNFWGSNLGGGYLAYVNKQTFEYRVWQVPISGYGMTVDSDGYVWVCSYEIARFDPETETWQTAQVNGGGGCMGDGNGRIWMASNPLVAVDTQTLQVVQTIPIPSYAHGVSIDFYGNVWGVTLYEPYAYRADPVTGVVDTFTGLNMPYTYSDMTGFALKNAGTIPMPQG